MGEWKGRGAPERVGRVKAPEVPESKVCTDRMGEG